MNKPAQINSGFDSGPSARNTRSPLVYARHIPVIVVVLIMTAILVACKSEPVAKPPTVKVTVVEVAELPTITIGLGDQLPLLPEQADVVYSDGTAGRLPVSWDVKGIENKRIWEHTTVNGTVVDNAEVRAITHLIEVVPNREPTGDGVGGIVPTDDSMAGLENLEMEWSGIEISQEVREELRAVVFRDDWISTAAALGGLLRYNGNEYLIVNGYQYCLANDIRIPTYDHYLALLKATYTGRLFAYFIERDLCIQVDSKLYCRPDGAGSVESVSGPTRMKVLEVSEQKIAVERSETVVGPDWSNEDVRRLEFLCVDGKWLLASYGFEL